MGRVAAGILLIAGLLFVADVLSPATPTPQVVQETVWVIVGLVLFLDVFVRPRLYLSSPPRLFVSVPVAISELSAFGMRPCVLLC
jgi:hypothetical protein